MFLYCRIPLWADPNEESPREGEGVAENVNSKIKRL
jgi:hypothetical protein